MESRDPYAQAAMRPGSGHHFDNVLLEDDGAEAGWPWAWKKLMDELG